MDVLILGAAYCDVVFEGLEAMPTLGRERFSRGLSLHAGGSAITAIALAKLGRPTALIANVGRDLHGERVMRDLSQAGVRNDWLTRNDRATPVTVVLPLADDRAFVTYAPNEPLAGIDEALRGSGARHLHVAGASVLQDDPTVIERAQALRCTVSFDPGWHDEALRDDAIRRGVDACDVLLPNRSEARALADLPADDHATRSDGARDALKRLALRRHSGITVVKDGARGAFAIHADQPSDIHHAAVPPRPIIDATGAGDVFDAAFLHSWLDDPSIDAALRDGAAAGALAVTAFGGATAAPTREHLEREREPS